MAEACCGGAQKKTEKFAKLLAVPAVETAPASAPAVLTSADISQLKEVLAGCTQQIEWMQREFVGRNQPAQPALTL